MRRAPGRHSPLVNAHLPSLRAGCGGIDLFGGAFSFINKQQFLSLLQNIGANAVGYAFKLALQSISPDIDKLLTELQDQINKINAMNINSCEAAQALVNGVVGKYDHSVMSGGGNIFQDLGGARKADMGVRGAVVLSPPQDDGSGAMPRYFEPTIVGLRDLLLGSGASA